VRGKAKIPDACRLMANWLRSKFRCPLCSSFGADKFTSVLSHIQCVHSWDPHFSIACGVDGCQVTYRNFHSYKSHLYRKHSGSVVFYNGTDDAASHDDRDTATEQMEEIGDSGPLYDSEYLRESLSDSLTSLVLLCIK
jgi:hypothetical protein